MSNRRRSERHRIELPVWLKDAHGGEETYTIDVSGHGIAVASLRTRPMRQYVELEIALEPEKRIGVTAIVARAIEDVEVEGGRRARGLGLDFFLFDSKAKAEWQRFMGRVRSLPAAKNAAAPGGSSPPAPGAAPPEEEDDDGTPTFIVKPRDLGRLWAFFRGEMSKGLVRIETPIAKAVGEPVELLVVHPTSQAEWTLEGRVARSVEHGRGGRPVLEIALAELDPGTRAAFRNFVATGFGMIEEDVQLSGDVQVPELLRARGQPPPAARPGPREVAPRGPSGSAGSLRPIPRDLGVRVTPAAGSAAAREPPPAIPAPRELSAPTAPSRGAEDALGLTGLPGLPDREELGAEPQRVHSIVIDLDALAEETSEAELPAVPSEGPLTPEDEAAFFEDPSLAESSSSAVYSLGDDAILGSVPAELDLEAAVAQAEAEARVEAEARRIAEAEARLDAERLARREGEGELRRMAEHFARREGDGDRGPSLDTDRAIALVEEHAPAPTRPASALLDPEDTGRDPSPSEHDADAPAPDVPPAAARLELALAGDPLDVLDSARAVDAASAELAPFSAPLELEVQELSELELRAADEPSGERAPALPEVRPSRERPGSLPSAAAPGAAPPPPLPSARVDGGAGAAEVRDLELEEAFARALASAEPEPAPGMDAVDSPAPALRAPPPAPPPDAEASFLEDETVLEQRAYVPSREAEDPLEEPILLRKRIVHDEATVVPELVVVGPRPGPPPLPASAHLRMEAAEAEVTDEEEATFDGGEEVTRGAQPEEVRAPSRSLSGNVFASFFFEAAESQRPRTVFGTPLAPPPSDDDEVPPPPEPPPIPLQRGVRLEVKQPGRAPSAIAPPPLPRGAPPAPPAVAPPTPAAGIAIAVVRGSPLAPAPEPREPARAPEREVARAPERDRAERDPGRASPEVRVEPWFQQVGNDLRANGPEEAPAAPGEDAPIPLTNPRPHTGPRRAAERRASIRGQLEESTRAPHLQVSTEGTNPGLDRDIALARARVVRSPESVTACYRLGSLLVRRGQLDAWQEAITTLNRVMSLEPNHPGAHHAIAEAHARRGEFEAALEHLRRARRLGYRIDPELERRILDRRA